MKAKWANILFSILLILASTSTVWADTPTPETTAHGKSGKTPLGLVSKTPEANEISEADEKSEKSQKSDKGQQHGAFGTVVSKTGDSLTIETKIGELVIGITQQTKFKIPHKKQATIADVAVGDRVAANGSPVTGGLTAKQVHVAPGKLTIRHRVGKVVSYSAGSSITIQAEDGTKEEFVLAADAKIRDPKGDGVTVGDRVTVISRRDPSSDIAIATGIVVHKQ